MKSKRTLGLVIQAVALVAVGQFMLAGCATPPVVGALKQATQQAAQANKRIAVLGQTKKVASALVASAYKTKSFPKSLDGIDLGGLPLQLNPKLAGVSRTTVKNPGKTVLVYEGAPGAPLFQHDGKAALGFADGHAQLMNAQTVQAQQLRWEQ